jgi:hypothetical protein
MPGNLFGFDARADDIHIDLAETTGRVVRFTARDDHVIEASAGVYSKTGFDERCALQAR